MAYRSMLSVSALGALLVLGACSSASDDPAPDATATESSTTEIAPSPESATQENSAMADADDEAVTPATADGVLGLEGLGELRIGEPVPADGTWAERGAQTGDACRTVSSPDYPGVYAIVTDGQVQRITAGQRSDVTLAEGIGVGASQAEVTEWFAGFREEPHKYVEAPAKYLTAPNAESGESALRFEIGEDGKVSMIHVGVMPVLAYVEGCA
ncbi:hypothetical protein [Pacificimonas flava]|uniref:Uncharacterized protein n=1 Tax=Pacificimonas flava TaxID=1234595 RepID=M2U4Q3_9SPHN|nr:hypothetical protein [Pacificimonas flava]EMD82958.1 hypothetical protein C725_1556 [Pacificimonas flava]MBB5280118.1 hypothetical protein [Pacificimonas flava]